MKKALVLIFTLVMLAAPAGATGLVSDNCWLHASVVKDAATLRDRGIAPTGAEAQFFKTIRPYFAAGKMSDQDLKGWIDPDVEKAYKHTDEAPKKLFNETMKSCMEFYDKE